MMEREPGVTIAGQHVNDGRHTYTGGSHGYFFPPSHVASTPPVPTPPTITSPLTATATVGVPFTYNIIASGTQPMTYNATPLPAGLSFTAPRSITGTPTGPAGIENITISATNSEGTDSQTLVLSVQASTLAAPHITSSATPPNATEGIAFSYTITATGVPAPTFGHTGLLPAWLTRSGSVLSGTPPSGSAPGPVTFTVTATNSQGSDSLLVTLGITAGATPGAWEVHHNFPAMSTFNQTTGLILLNATNWPGWTSAMDADMTDALYLTPPASYTMNDLPVHLYATYSGMTELRVPFDNWTGNPTVTNQITEWGYNSSVHGIYIVGNNATGAAIALRLERA